MFEMIYSLAWMRWEQSMRSHCSACFAYIMIAELQQCHNKELGLKVFVRKAEWPHLLVPLESFECVPWVFQLLLLLLDRHCTHKLVVAVLRAVEFGRLASGRAWSIAGSVFIRVIWLNSVLMCCFVHIVKDLFGCKDPGTLSLSFWLWLPRRWCVSLLFESADARRWKYWARFFPSWGIVESYLWRRWLGEML